MTTIALESADWCAANGNGVICGSAYAEFSRQSIGVRWCFTCRKRHEFWQVCYAPIGLSYYGPHVNYEGVWSSCSDLFPGWTREVDQ